MYKVIGVGALLLAAAACGSVAADKAGKSDKEGKDEKGEGVMVALDTLKSRAPASWKKEKPASRLRYAQFTLPAAGKDKKDADVVIYQNLGGNVKANVARWKAQFVPPRGKTIDDVSKVTKVDIAGEKATYVDVHGTFRPPPFDPKYKGEPQENFRMLAIQYKGPKNLYHIKLTGPAATVEHYKKGFDAWLKGFKKE
jgi:hypothetical protein